MPAYADPVADYDRPLPGDHVLRALDSLATVSVLSAHLQVAAWRRRTRAAAEHFPGDGPGPTSQHNSVVVVRSARPGPRHDLVTAKTACPAHCQR